MAAESTSVIPNLHGYLQESMQLNCHLTLEYFRAFIKP